MITSGEHFSMRTIDWLQNTPLPASAQVLYLHTLIRPAFRFFIPQGTQNSACTTHAGGEESSGHPDERFAYNYFSLI